MKYTKGFLVLAACLLTLALSGQARADAVAASGFLSGSNFLQSGSVTNNSTTGLSITSVIYSFGAAANGIATWDSNAGTSLGGGTPSGFLSDPRWFQTITFSGLNITPGATFNFGGLDVDFIQTLSPLGINETTIDNIGTTLSTATLSVVFNNGAVATAMLNQTGWTVNQNLTLAPVNSSVPEPTTLLLLGTGLSALAAKVRSRRRMTD